MYLSGWLSPSPRRLQIQIRHHVLHFVRIDDFLQLLGVRPHLGHHGFRSLPCVGHALFAEDHIPVRGVTASCAISKLSPVCQPCIQRPVQEPLVESVTPSEVTQVAASTDRKQNFPPSEADQAGEASQASSSESCPEAFT